MAGDSTGSEREAGVSGVSVPGRFRELVLRDEGFLCGLLW